MHNGLFIESDHRLAISIISRKKDKQEDTVWNNQMVVSPLL